MYDMDSAAALLGKSKTTIYHWLKHYGLKTSVIILDRRRAYISDEDMFVLLAHFNRKNPGNALKGKIFKKYRAKLGKTKEMDTAEVDTHTIVEGELNSLPKVALFFGVSVSTVRGWIKQHNIEIVRINTGRRERVYLTYDDVLKLTRFYSRKVADPKVHNIVEVVRKMRQQLEKLTADVEEIKHDMRVYVRRSIYVG